MIKEIRKPLNKRMITLIAFFLIISATACDTEPQDWLDPTSEEQENWSEKSHSNTVEPNYETVFPQDAINRINITISEENWEEMMIDMTKLMGEFSSGDGMVRPGDGKFQRNPPFNNPQDNPSPGNETNPEEEPPEIPNQGEMPEKGLPPQAGNFPPDGPGFDVGESHENPIWVTGTIEFEGDVWEHVGIRFKGNSSLRSAWSSGSFKIPFKLDFDQFEDDFPEIEDQRFYGFKQLSLSNNFSDDSYLREKITADIFREFGIPSAHTAFYEVYVDYGEGLEYFGLYTMVEMVEDTVIEEQFSDDSGNLYKPEGAGATFAEGSFSESSFDKETNQDEGDYSDILAVFEALHAENRLTDPKAWRQQLESVFDVDTFLRWLAANTTIQNWDTYAVTNHNYYLYTDPDSSLVTWIPWDNNMALSDSEMRRMGETLSLSLDEVSDRYPLIRFLMDDPIYQAKYETYLADFLETTFIPEEWEQKIVYYHQQISDSVLKETEEATTLSSPRAFEDSVEDLIEHFSNRYQAVADFLSK